LRRAVAAASRSDPSERSGAELSAYCLLALRKNAIIYRRHVTLFNELLTRLSKRLSEIRIEALWERLEAAEPLGTLIHIGEFSDDQQDPPGVGPALTLT